MLLGTGMNRAPTSKSLDLSRCSTTRGARPKMLRHPSWSNFLHQSAALQTHCPQRDLWRQGFAAKKLCDLQSGRKIQTRCSHLFTAYHHHHHLKNKAIAGYFHLFLEDVDRVFKIDDVCCLLQGLQQWHLVCTSKPFSKSTLSSEMVAM
jgi:hypothetical protein